VPRGPIARADTRARVVDLCNSYQNTTFSFARHREPERYRLIAECEDAVLPRNSGAPGRHQARILCGAGHVCGPDFSACST
jgi:hypothetical protein